MYGRKRCDARRHAYRRRVRCFFLSLSVIYVNNAQQTRRQRRGARLEPVMQNRRSESVPPMCGTFNEEAQLPEEMRDWPSTSRSTDVANRVFAICAWLAIPLAIASTAPVSQ